MAPRAAIEIENLKKSFRVRKARGTSVVQRLASLIAGEVESVVAVDGVSFAVEAGERVAFIGPNGAGKSTTLKILSGILQPDSGRAEVLGLVPWEARAELGFRAGTVFGQRSQLWYDLPPADTFALLARVYELPDAEYRARFDALVTAFELAPLLEKPVKSLSLGERMRCEIAASLLHKPSILFLDEPTIGLDVSAKAVIRDLLLRRSADDAATLLLTSHDTGDIEHVCDRVIVIHGGRILLDGPVAALRQTLTTKRLTLLTDSERIALDLPGLELVAAEAHRATYSVDTAKTPLGTVVEAAVRQGGLRDLSIEDPPLDVVIRSLYERADGSRAA